MKHVTNIMLLQSHLHTIALNLVPQPVIPSSCHIQKGGWEAYLLIQNLKLHHYILAWLLNTGGRE